jgi:hypothetical protein
MEASRRSGLAGGIVLILIGLCALIVELTPGLRGWIHGSLGWPLIVVAAGVLLLVIGLLTGALAAAIPACIVAGIGGLLYWQNATGRWESWAYAWALIPGFAGAGTILAGLLQRRPKEVGGGAWLVFISLVLFAVFASFFGGGDVFGPCWPVLIIVLGLVLLVRRLVLPASSER